MPYEQQTNKINILYDHYKESNTLVQNMAKDRNMYFKYLWLIIFFNLLFLLYPNDFIENISNLLNDKYNMNFSNIYVIIQSTLWLLTILFLIQYLHKNIYIERQYIYIKKFEKEISNLLNTNVFNREGDNYIENYPIVLNVLDFFYKWIIPLSIVLIMSLKLYFEYRNNVCMFLKIFDTSCFIFIFIIIIFYLKFLNLKNTNDINNLKYNVKINIIATKSTKN